MLYPWPTRLRLWLRHQRDIARASHPQGLSRGFLVRCRRWDTCQRGACGDIIVSVRFGRWNLEFHAEVATNSDHNDSVTRLRDAVLLEFVQVSGQVVFEPRGWVRKFLPDLSKSGTTIITGKLGDVLCDEEFRAEVFKCLHAVGVEGP